MGRRKEARWVIIATLKESLALGLVHFVHYGKAPDAGMKMKG